MTDGYGRTIDYMRISITDRCNLRCSYCMPDGIRQVPMEEILTYEEIAAVCRAGAELGIRHIKITGGEPLVRKGCPELIGRLRQIPGIEAVTITTNGLLLAEQLDALREAGVSGINVSLDTLDRERYRNLTGFDGLSQVLAGIRAAVESGIPVKINAVSMEENLHPGWRELAELARSMPVDVRFIEMMPIGLGRQFETVSHKTLLLEILAAYPGMEPDDRRHGFGPAVYYRIPGFSGSIGLISAIHGKFCGSCNRVRLTSTGFLKGCLCYEGGVDLRKILRNRQEGEELVRAMEQVIRKKPDAHCFEEPEQITETKLMSGIGG